ncbi:MAG TPA: hypothetical protein VK718_04315 [Ferruginibacter sp.]|jgi:hypothetical protein|nr:hypothetical protein [Ferruginibacter sp.]
MKIARLLFVFLLSACALHVHAQDIILTRDSLAIKAKVEKITPKEIIYKKTDNPDGPEYVIYRKEVENITFANGTVEEMGNNGRVHHFISSRFTINRNTRFGKNILSFAFIQVSEITGMNTGSTDNAFPGIGIHYEHMLNDAGTWSFYLPATLSFYNISNGDDYYDYSTHAFFYMYPGVKFYPLGSKRRISYSVGPSLAIGFGRRYFAEGQYSFTDSTDVYSYATASKPVLKLGLMINNGLNFMLGKHLYLGAELGLGVTFYNNDYNEDHSFDYNVSNNKNHAGTPIVQFNAKFGYRF